MAQAFGGERIYPVDEWKVTEVQFDYASNYRDETVFALANGYLGVRGGYEEGYAGPLGTSWDGTFINGFYESSDIAHPEAAYGLASTRQTMLNITRGKVIRLAVDGESFQLREHNTKNYLRELDFRTGILRRSLVWTTSSGKSLEIVSERLVSFTRKHVFAIRYRVTPLDFDGEITLVSALDGDVKNRVSSADPRVGAFFSGRVLMVDGATSEGAYACLSQKTKVSQFSLEVGMCHRLKGTEEHTITPAKSDTEVSLSFVLKVRRGEAVELEKHVAYFHSKQELREELPALTRFEATKSATDGFDVLAQEQASFLASFWDRTAVSIHGDPATQQGLRFNIFHLLQSVGRDGRTNIGAKGITGEGYEGHYFWDTDAYVCPMFLFTSPEITRALIEHRTTLLEKARERARELSLRGALYAWRTIDGEELSAYFPAGTAQYHINADIVFALKKYVKVTGDEKFLFSTGAEMLFETARAWMSIGAFVRDRGFCINCVTGPDEYTALINNNLYTNVMAKDHLEFAVETVRRMKQQQPRDFDKLARKIGLDESEPAEWKRAAEHMYTHFDKELCIYGQDDSFLHKAKWEFKSLPAEKHPFNMHFHYLHIYRYQVIKQADALLAMLFQGNRFSRLDKIRAFDYYEPLCTHDSSLSAAIHGILAAELGDIDRAYAFFGDTARMDLDDTHRNVRDGVHIANMAGTWLSLVNGFGGMRDYDGKLTFSPSLPRQWKGYSFRIAYRDSILQVEVGGSEVVYTLIAGQPVSFAHHGETCTVEAGTPIARPLRPPVKGVLFDLDGVITDSAEFHYLAWKRLADEIGIPFDRVFNEQLKGVGRLDSLDLILTRGHRKVDEATRLELADRKNGYYLAFIKELTPNDLLPGARELLEGLRAEGIKTALCSASKNGPEVIERLGIGHLFDVVVNPALLQKGTPDPEIFLKGAEMLGLRYEECVGIEDTEAGVTAIKKAAMRAVGVNVSSKEYAPDLAVKSLERLTVQRVLALGGRR